MAVKNFSFMSQNGKVQYNLIELVVDKEADISTLPTTDVAPGSTCFVIETSKAYMFTIAGEWKELQ